jgi:hypothetical protein
MLIIQRTEPAKQRETCRSGIRVDGAFSLGFTVHLEARSNRVVTKALVYDGGGSSYAAQKVLHRLAGEAYEYDPLGNTSRRMRYFVEGPREVAFIDGHLRVLPRWDDDPQIPKELREVVEEELTNLVVPIVGWPTEGTTAQPQINSTKAIEDRVVAMSKLGLRETTVVLSADIVRQRSRREKSGETTVFDVAIHPWVPAETDQGDCREGTFDLSISVDECERNVLVSTNAR